MRHEADLPILTPLFDSWDQNKPILFNLLRAIPKAGWQRKEHETCWTLAQQVVYIRRTRPFPFRGIHRNS